MARPCAVHLKCVTPEPAIELQSASPVKARLTLPSILPYIRPAMGLGWGVQRNNLQTLTTANELIGIFASVGGPHKIPELSAGYPGSCHIP